MSYSSSHTTGNTSIQLSSFNFNDSKTFDVDANPFDASLPPTPNTASSLIPQQRNRRKLLSSIPWSKLEDGLWIVLPLIFHITAIIVLGTALFSQGLSYLDIKQTPGTGKLTFGILSSCVTLPGSVIQTCTPRLLKANFVPSLEVLGPFIPGFAILVLPFYSDQTTVIFLTSFILITTSFFVFLFPWSLAYFPNTNYPKVLKSSIKNYSKTWYRIAGALAFASFVFTLTIGIGYHLMLQDVRQEFNDGVTAATVGGLVGDGVTAWEAKLGPGFQYVWTATILSALTALGMNIALHNRIDLIIERGGEEKHRTLDNFY